MSINDVFFQNYDVMPFVFKKNDKTFKFLVLQEVFIIEIILTIVTVEWKKFQKIYQKI